MCRAPRAQGTRWHCRTSSAGLGMEAPTICPLPPQAPGEAVMADRQPGGAQIPPTSLPAPSHIPDIHAGVVGDPTAHDGFGPFDDALVLWRVGDTCPCYGLGGTDTWDEALAPGGLPGWHRQGTAQVCTHATQPATCQSPSSAPPESSIPHHARRETAPSCPQNWSGSILHRAGRQGGRQSRVTRARWRAPYPRPPGRQTPRPRRGSWWPGRRRCRRRRGARG